MSFTYAELKQAIKDYTENDETTFTNNLPVFIRNAEERILKNVQLSEFRKNVTGSSTTSNKFLDCPSDFLAPFSLSFEVSSSKVFVEYKDVNFLQTFHPDASSTGTPRYYALFDSGNFILAPTPDAALVAELHYFYRPASLTSLSESSQSWLSENAPLALLYASLLEAYTFMKGEQDVLSLYASQLQNALVALKQFGEAKEVTDQYMTGMVIRPKQ
tara:strand:- start:243 stop:890 length:648 start_codon:yes stop_codon:yes gene_type:complete